MTTTHTKHKDLMERANHDLWAQGNLDFIEEYVAEDYVEYNNAAPAPIRGRDGYRENVEMVRTGFPDLAVSTEHLIAEGDLVANHYTITGTHDGPFMGLEPTGIEVRISGISIGQIDAGKVVAGWTVADTMGLLQQLGAVEPPGE